DAGSPELYGMKIPSFYLNCARGDQARLKRSKQTRVRLGTLFPFLRQAWSFAYEATAARARNLGITDMPLSFSKRRLIDCEHGPQSQKCSSFSGGLREATRKGLLFSVAIPVCS